MSSDQFIDLIFKCVFEMHGIYLVLHFVGAFVLLWFMGDDRFHNHPIVQVIAFPFYFFLWPMLLLVAIIAWPLILLLTPAR